MTAHLREWIYGMTAVSLCCAIAMSLTPDGRVKSVLRLCCTLAMTVALLSPLGKVDIDVYAQSLARYRDLLQQAEKSGTEKADRLNRTVIEAECAAYISDKGAELGLGAVSVQVQAKWGDAFWYPYEVWLEAQPSEELLICLEGELGVPRERVHWKNEDTG